MSFFSFSQRNKESYSLVFNIGSGGVSGGIIKFTEKPGETILYYGQEIFPFQPEISASKHLDLLKSSLTTLAGKIQTEGFKKINNKKNNLTIDRVFYIFSSPWSVSQTKTIRLKEPKAVKISEAYLNKLIDEQGKQFQAEISKSGQVIEKKIIQTKINGYLVENIYNKLVKDLEVSVFLTVVPKEILDAVEGAVSKVFNLKDIWCHSLSLPVFSIIRNFFPQKEDFIYIDVSDEMTDISIIKDGLISSGASLPLGRNHYIRELSKISNVAEEVANSMVRMHTSKSNDELAALKLSVSMDQAVASWLAKIFEILDSLREKIYVPDSIFLVSSDDLLPFLKEKLQKHDFKVFLLDNKKLKPPIVGDDLSFKLVLMFLDNLYKI